MAERLSTGLRNEILKSGGKSMADALVNGVIHIFDGTQPASADDTEVGYNLLAIITDAGGTFVPGSATNGLNLDVAVGGVVSKKTTEDWETLSALVTGLAGWYRFYNNAVTTGASTTAIRKDGAIANSGAELNMSNRNIVATAPVSLDGYAVTWPAS